MVRRTRICAVPGCSGVAYVGKWEGRCEAHKPPAKRQGSPDKRLPEHAWRRIRASVLRRDEWSCVRCGDPATEVDHIVPLSQNGSNDPHNLRSVCRACHIYFGHRQRNG